MWWCHFTHLDNVDIIDIIDIDIREHVVVPLHPLVDDPLVPLHHGAAQVLHALVHLALDNHNPPIMIRPSPTQPSPWC